MRRSRAPSAGRTQHPPGCSSLPPTPGSSNSCLHCGSICAGSAREARPALSGFTWIKNKSDCAYVRGAGLWLAQSCGETLPNWDREVTAVTSMRHNPSLCTKHATRHVGFSRWEAIWEPKSLYFCYRQHLHFPCSDNLFFQYPWTSRAP